MKRSFCLSIATIVALSLVTVPVASAAVIVDGFEDGTTQGWTVGVGPAGGSHPSPPTNIADGGPLGVGDNYLRLSSFGGSGAGSRLTALNLNQWAGNYTTGGITTISMDLINEGNTDLSIRLYLENPLPGPPTAGAVTDAVFLPAASGWTHADFAVDATSLTQLFGDVNALLTKVTVLRIFHNPVADFPVLSGPPVIVAQLGVDNITAPAPGSTTPTPAAVPEPSSLLMFALGLLALARRRSGTVGRA